MLGVTVFGVLLTPVFYYVIAWLTERPVVPATAHQTSAMRPDGVPSDGAAARAKPASPPMSEQQ
jgi:hypothetical protein